MRNKLDHRMQKKARRLAVSRRGAQSGQSLVEIGLLVPVLVLMTVGLVDLGRILMIQHVITNAAREGVRVAILPGADTASVSTTVQNYLQDGGLDAEDVAITVSGTNAATTQPAQVTVTYSMTSLILEMVHTDSTIMLSSTSGMPHE